VLINNGHGEFTWQPAARTGLKLRGELRDIKKIMIGTRPYFLFLQNNEFPALYQLDSDTGRHGVNN
jgi:hypothetical protein